MEGLLVSLDRAARFGIRTNVFLSLLSEYLVCACEEQSPVPAYLMVAAFKCLNEGLRTTLDQFTRVSLLATSSCQANVLSAMDIPFEGVKKGLQDLPLLGSDLFHNQFQDVMETEAK